jgi:hypothetical protein
VKRKIVPDNKTTNGTNNTNGGGQTEVKTVLNLIESLSQQYTMPAG